MSSINNAIFISLSKQMANFRNLEVRASNMSKQEIPGSKAMSILEKPYFILDDENKHVDFVNDIKTYHDQSNGSIKITGNPLDVAIEGNGYFSVATNNGIEYTRAGNFKLNNKNQLASFDNFPILDVNGQAIIFENTDVGITIDQKGFIRSLNRQIAQLNITSFEDLNKIEPLSNNRFSSDSQIINNNQFKLVQNAIEESNINPVKELTSLIELQRKTEFVKNITDIMEQIEQKSVDDLAKSVKG